MKHRILLVLSLALMATTARAEEGTALERVELRVSSTWPGGRVVVDRGKSDGLQPGDRVFFYPRGGATYAGSIVSVEERSAIVEMQDKQRVPKAGTRGEAMVPVSRLTAPPDKEPGAEQGGEPGADTGEDTPEGAAEHPPWENKDEEWQKGKPLLDAMRPVRPKDRAKRLEGLWYILADVTENPAGDYDNSFYRMGTSFRYLNPFDRGGEVHVDAEVSYLTEFNDNAGVDLLFRRLSYRWGGTRFEDQRFEVGRFLQYGVPELGVLDGIEWQLRRANGHRLGASIGLMPEPDDDFSTGSDLQVAVYYEWISGQRDEMMFGIAYHKSWHDLEADRDLIVAKARYLPLRGWEVFATAWIDIYTDGDNLKGSGIELTQVVATASRRWARGGVEVNFLHQRFPELLRNGEFIPPLDAAIIDNRYDRLGLNFWRWITQEKRIHSHLSGYDDEQGNGGAADLGLELRNVLGKPNSVDLTLFAAAAQFEDLLGGRISYSRFTQKGRWDVLYEIGQHHLNDFPDDRDDIIQHRVRGSWSLYNDQSGWDFTAYAQGVLYDDELSWSAGITFQKRF